MKVLTLAELNIFFTQLTREYDLRIPVVGSDGSRVFGCLDDGPPALVGGPILAKPTSLFFPQTEDLYISPSPEVSGSVTTAKRICAVGFTPKDLLCLAFTDRFFTEGFRDDVYFDRRDGAVIVAVSGCSDEGGDFVEPAGGGCDLELVFDGADWIVAAYTDAGERIYGQIPGGETDDGLAPLLSRFGCTSDSDSDVVKAASDILLAGRVPDTLWEEIAASCILCTGCNLVCPTCTCFGVQDWRYSDRLERSRMWDSCQLDGFAREAGGHNPLGTEALRTRRRIHHKLAADLVKRGDISCMVCGRCDTVCPTGIGMVAVASQIVKRYGGG